MTVHFGHRPLFAEKNFAQKALEWAKSRQEMVAVTGIVLLLLAVGIPYYQHNQAQAEKDAQGVLNLGQYYLHASVDPKNGPFKTELEKQQQALQTFQRIITDYSGTQTAKVARYYVAKSQYQMGQFTQAYSSFDSASQGLKDTPLGDQAFLGKVLSLEAENQLGPATTLSETFLKEHGDSFMAPEIRLNLADLYLKAQNKDKALEQLKWVAQNFADSDWGKEASRRLESLKS